MASDSDYLLALNLQIGFEEEFRIENPPTDLTYTAKKMKNEKSCLVDPCWELIDPTPDIHTLFVSFNERFFWNKLLAVTVSWSKKMTTCAGICSYQGRGGLCYITLSEPLLKLRPRKDLVETMLHEMIHAYLFVTNNDRDRDGHGPEFHKHMYRINAEAGTNITVYHDFHEEVRLYKVHVWRCQGPCRYKPPYYGVLRRATNRKPSPHDRWWREHQAKCGGNFVKIEPVPKVEASANPQKQMPRLDDIRKYISTTSATAAAAASSPNRNGTVVVMAKPGKENRAEGVAGTPPRRAIIAFSGAGHSLVGTGQASSPKCDYDVVRNHWVNKFHSGDNQLKRKSDGAQGSSKRSPPRLVQCPRCDKTVPRTHLEAHDLVCKMLMAKVNCPNCGRETDKNQVNEHLDMCLAQSEPPPAPPTKVCAYCSTDVAEELYDTHLASCLRNLYEKQVDDKLLCIVCNSYVKKDKLAQHRDQCVVELFDDDDEMA